MASRDKEMDRIIARGLEFQGRHGVCLSEREKAQSFRVDLELFLDLRAAAEQDDLALTIDYGETFQIVKNIVEKESCKLLETLAEKIASALLDTFARLRAVEVQLAKPHAPVKGKFDYFAVKIRREK